MRYHFEIVVAIRDRKYSTPQGQ